MPAFLLNVLLFCRAETGSYGWEHRVKIEKIFLRSFLHTSRRRGIVIVQLLKIAEHECLEYLSSVMGPAVGILFGLLGLPTRSDAGYVL